MLRQCLSIYQHDVVVHAQHFLDEFHRDMHTQTIEGLWVQITKVGQVMAFSEATSLLSSGASATRNVFGQLINLLSDNYNI